MKESSQARIQELEVEAEPLTRELPELERSLSEARARLAELLHVPALEEVAPPRAACVI